MNVACNYPIFSFGSCVNFERYRYGIGIVLLLFMQLVYIFRHKQGFVWNWKEMATGYLVFFIMAFKVWEDTRHLTKSGATYDYLLLGLVVVYSMVLCVSTWMAIGTTWRDVFPRQTAWLIAIGMFLFFYSDNSLGRFIVFPDTVPIYELESFILFENKIYIPSVVYSENTVSVFIL